MPDEPTTAPRLPQRGTPDRPPRNTSARDSSADTACVNRLVSRTGCTIRVATLQLEGETIDRQRVIAASEPADPSRDQADRLAVALKKLADASLDPKAPCPLGKIPPLKKGGPPRSLAYGDVVAKMVLQGRDGDVDEMIRRVA